MMPSHIPRTCRHWMLYLASGLGALLAILLCLSLAPSATAEGTGDWPPDAGLDWIVDEETYGYNASIRLIDPIVVRNSTTLTLENVTFTFASQELDEIGIKVVGDSRLVMMNVTFEADGPGGYYMELGENVGGYFENVTISGVASADPAKDGAVINGDGFTISNSTFHDSNYGIITSGELVLANNTFYNTSVAIHSSGDLHIDEVQDNTFEHGGYNNTRAWFQHTVDVDLDVVDQEGKTLGGARVVAVDQFGQQRLSMLAWNDGKLWGASLMDEELTIEGTERFPSQYNCTASYLTASKVFALDLNVTTSLHMVLPLLPELTAGSLYAPLPASMEVLRPGRDNATAMRWTDVSAPGGDWRELDYDDSAWYDGTLPLGNNSVEGVDAATHWEGGVAYLRLPFFIPQGSVIHNGTLRFSAMAPIGGDRINVYLNGPDALAAWQGEASYWSYTKEISRDNFRTGLNVLTIRFQAQEAPFLDVQMEVIIAREPDEPLISGSPMELMAVVTNNGSRDAEAVDVELWLDDQLARSLVRNIPANSSRIYIFDLPNLTAGPHSFELRLDPQAELNETDRDDNTAWLNTTAYDVAFEIVTAPEDIDLHTFDREAVVVEVINQGEVDDWPRLARAWPWTLWSVELVQPPAKIAPGARANLTLWITPPASITADDYVMELEIGSALGPGAPNNSAPFNFTITVLQSMDLAFQDPGAIQLFPLGAPTPLSLTLANTGNIPFSADISLAGLASAEADGWNITLLTKVADVDPGETYQVNLQVLLLTNGSRLPTTITVQATAPGDPAVQDNLTVELIPAGFSTAEALAPYQRAKTFYLPWSVLDHEDSIDRVELHYRELPLGGSWSSWILFYTDLEEGVHPPFTGVEGYTYEFHTIAVFSGGDREQKDEAESTTIMDLTPPKSRLTLQTPVNGEGVTVISALNISWRHLDSDGVAFNIELKMDNGPWTILEENTTSLNGVYQLEPGHSYMVQSRAWDLAGWKEAESSGLNRVSFTILERPYLVRLATNKAASMEAGVTGWILLEPMAQVKKVQIQYLDGDDEWVTFQRLTLAGPDETPAQNTSFALNIPLEGVNLLRAVEEDDQGDPVTPGAWQVTVLGNGVSGLEMTLQRRPIWSTLTVAADPNGTGAFDRELTEGVTALGFERNVNPPLLIFGDGVRGYRPAANEPVRATYLAYDVRVVRDSLPPLAPAWLDVQPDNQSRSVNLELELTEPSAVVAFWFERSSNPEVTFSWTRFTVSDITILPEDNIVSQLDSNLTPEESIYYRLGVKDKFDRISYSSILEVNLSFVPTNTDIDTTPSSDSGRLTGNHIILITILALLVVGGVMTKFFLDGRKEREAFPYPPADQEYRDYSLAGFEMVGDDMKEKLTVECLTCGTRRNVAHSQAGEEISCYGCGSVATLVKLEDEIEDQEPEEDYKKPDLGTITVGGFEVEAPYPIYIPGQEEAPEEDEAADETEEAEATEAEETEDAVDDAEPAEAETATEDDAAEAVETVEAVEAQEAEEALPAEPAEEAPEADEAEVVEVEAVEPVDDIAEVEEVQEEVVEAVAVEPEPEADDAEAEPADEGLPIPCPDCGKEIGPFTPEELANCDGCGWSE